MAQTNQGGSVLGFVVVAIIMAGLLVGGVFLVRQLTAVPQETLQPTEAAQDKSDSTQTDNKQSENDKKTEESTGSSQPPAGHHDTSTDTPAQPASELPRTGPASLLGSTVMLAVLSVLVVSYARSRHVELSL
jgi:cytoskeletal protein RodZ